MMMTPAQAFRKITEYFSLDSEVEAHDSIHAEILKGIAFKGTNLWILVFAIVVASVGLNVNSTAVIIGAMLISPLMGPINAMGYSIATYNFELFKKGRKKLSICGFNEFSRFGNLLRFKPSIYRTFRIIRTYNPYH